MRVIGILTLTNFQAEKLLKMVSSSVPVVVSQIFHLFPGLDDFIISLSGTRDESYDTFLADIMSCGPEDCRYGLFDFEYRHQCEGTNEKSKKEKLLLMTWCPDTAKIKKKMLYSSSFDALKKCLVGSITYIQVCTLQ